MYKSDNIITLNINETYNRLSYKCVANTNVCSCLVVQAACDYAACVGRNFLNEKIKEINKAYSIYVVSTKYSASRTYKFKGITVPECIATVVFKIMYNGSFLGHVLEKGLIQQIIKANNGDPKFLA